MLKILNSFTLIIVLNICISAQPYNLDDLKLWQIKGYARSAAIQGDTYSSILFYQFLVNKYPGKKKYQWALACQLLKSRNYREAYYAFDKLSLTRSKKDQLYIYYKAICAKSLGRHLEAFNLLNSLRIRKQKKWMPRYFEEMVDNQRIGCELAMNLKDSLMKIDVKRLNESINHAHVEFNPFFLSDSVFVYSSSNTDSLMYFNIDQEIPRRRFQIAKRENGKWKGGYKASNPFFNSNEYDTGDGVYSLDGNRFYYTQCRKNWKGKVVCHLYVSIKIGGKWGNPQMLNDEINIPDYTASEPAVGTCYDPDLEVIYFVSDRPEGYGGTDIWYTIYDVVNGTYQKPINAGIYINTFGDETTPYYDTDNHRMFFSSNGWSGIGGLDVFHVKGDLVNWEEVVNVGYPVNSEYDDLYYTEHQLGNKGFFTSNRPGGISLAHSTCCDDIFEWETSDVEKVWVQGSIVGNKFDLNKLMSKEAKDISDMGKSLGLDSAKVNLFLKKDTSNLVFISKQITDDSGKFKFLVPKGFEYEVFVDDSRVLDKKITIDTRQVGMKELNLKLKPIAVKTISNNPIVLENIYYEFNNTELSEESKEVLNQTLLKLMQDYEDLLVEVRSHTDDVGSSRYNLRLSNQRSKSVVEYLVSKGIDKYRLKAIGFGETIPVASNTLPDGSDNPDGRALNRRTEFRLVDSREIK